MVSRWHGVWHGRWHGMAGKGAWKWRHGKVAWWGDGTVARWLARWQVEAMVATYGLARLLDELERNLLDSVYVLSAVQWK